MAWVALIVAFVATGLILGAAWVLRARRRPDQSGAIIAAYVGATVIPLIGSILIPAFGIGFRGSSQIAVFMPLIGIGFGVYLLVEKNFLDGICSIILALSTMLFLVVMDSLMLCGGC